MKLFRPLPQAVLLEQRLDPAAVYGNRAARDVARTLRDKKRSEGGEFRGFAEASHRDLGRPASLDLVGGERFFFGEEVDFPAAPLVMAALAGCPVILFFGLYLGGNRYQVHFEPLAERIVLDRRQRQEQLGVWVQRYADRLERYTRLAPYNWFNFYDYWREDGP